MWNQYDLPELIFFNAFNIAEKVEQQYIAPKEAFLRC